MSPGMMSASATCGSAFHWSKLVRGIDTPAAAHACWVSREQSKPRLHGGPVPPNTYGQPRWLYANATAAPAAPLTFGGGGCWPPVGPVGGLGTPPPGPVD